eukprot:5734302-Prymnesium_polylepis.1
MRGLGGTPAKICCSSCGAVRPPNGGSPVSSRWSSTPSDHASVPPAVTWPEPRRHSGAVLCSARASSSAPLAAGSAPVCGRPKRHGHSTCAHAQLVMNVAVASPSEPALPAADSRCAPPRTTYTLPSCRWTGTASPAACSCTQAMKRSASAATRCTAAVCAGPAGSSSTAASSGTHVPASPCAGTAALLAAGGAGGAGGSAGDATTAASAGGALGGGAPARHTNALRSGGGHALAWAVGAPTGCAATAEAVAAVAAAASVPLAVAGGAVRATR